MTPAAIPNRLLACAAAFAFGAALVAVCEHSACTDAGYRMGRAQRENAVLEEAVGRAERRVAALRAPHAVLARARRLELGLDYPTRWNVVRAADLARPPSSVAPAQGEVPAPSAAPAERGRP